MENNRLKGLYIKTAVFGKGAAGGGITHTIGMINGFVDSGVDLTVLSTTEFDPCKADVVVLPVEYNKKQAPFIRDYIYYSKYEKSILHWLEQTDNHYDFVYCRHMLLCGILNKIARRISAISVLEVNGTRQDSSWSLILQPKMLTKPKLIRPLYYMAKPVVSTWIKKIEDPAIRSADRITVVSKPIKEKLVKKKLAEEKRILVLPNGVDTDEFLPSEAYREEIRRKLQIDRDQVVLGFAGTFGNWHGIPELTKAIAALSDRKDMDFLLIGDGLLRPQMEKEIGGLSNVHFLGVVPHGDMPKYLAACDILAVTNSWDPKYKESFFGSPTKLFEYMASGRAIVASRLEQIAELLTDGETAAMFEPGNVDDLTDTIKRLADNPALRERLGKNAREAAIADHTWKQNAAKVADFVRQQL